MPRPTQAELEREELERQQRREALRAAGATAEEIDAITDTEEASFTRPAFRAMPPAEQLASLRVRRADANAAFRSGYREKLIELGAPELHLRNVFDNEPKPTPALEAARKFVENDAVFLLLVGGVGTGKTAAAVHAMAGYCMPPQAGTWFSKRVDAMLISADKIAQLGGFQKAEELAAVEKCRFLIIDDLGAEYGDAKGWFASLFAALINKRYGAMLKTVITSNLTKEQIKAAYGERVADRFRECAVVVSDDGESLRSHREPKHIDRTPRPASPSAGGRHFNDGIGAQPETCEEMFDGSSVPIRRYSNVQQPRPPHRAVERRGNLMALSTEPTPTRAAEPESIVNAAELRRLDCAGYNRCLSRAVAEKWPGFACGACAAHEPIEGEQRAFDCAGLLALACWMEGP